jgi:hypothetical protein
MLGCCFSAGTVIEPSKIPKAVTPKPVNTVVSKPPPPPVLVKPVLTSTQSPPPLPEPSSVAAAPLVQIKEVEDEDYSDMPPLISVDDIPTYPDSEVIFTQFVNMFESISCSTTKCNERIYIKYEAYNGSLDIVVYTVGDYKFISLNGHSIELDVFNHIENVTPSTKPELTNISFKNETTIQVTCPMNIVVRALSDNLYNKDYETFDDEDEDEADKPMQIQTEEVEVEAEAVEEENYPTKGLLYFLSIALVGVGIALPYKTYYENLNK